MSQKIDDVRDLLKVQGFDGTWNYDPYMMGLYNGLELALAVLEGRQPEYKDAPEKWLADFPEVTEDFNPRG